MALAIRLVPYFALVLAYMLGFDICHGYPPQTITAAIVKASPVWYLIAFTTCLKKKPPGQHSLNAFEFLIALGLLLSSCGDVTLVWRDTLFIPGMLFFALAHVCYIVALKVEITDHKDKDKHTDLFVLMGTCSFLFVSSGIDSLLMAVLVMLYTALLFWMGSLSFQRYTSEKTLASKYGAMGAACFLLSDFLIAVQKWKCSLPFSEFIIMVTYYAAQLGIAVSTVSLTSKLTSTEDEAVSSASYS